MKNQEIIYLNAFNQIPQIGSVRFRKIINHFDSLEQAWGSSWQEFYKAGLNEKISQNITDQIKQIEPETEYKKLTDQNINVISLFDKIYPKLLTEIPNPPIVLYVRGSIDLLNQTALAVVGSRKISPYGKRATDDLVINMVRANLCIVSGLALGTDTQAHSTAVKNSGKTIAVLANGLDSIYPASNRYLAEQIIDSGGSIVSELPLGTPPLKHNFPNRNRIISGLSLGTIVIEAAEQSGALITAKHALEQNRQIYAVPGSIYSEVSVGPNNLLKMGAKPVTEINDILEDLNIETTKQEEKTKKLIGETKEEQIILNQLSTQPIHANQITKASGLPSSKIASTLIILEMKGMIKNLGANQYVLRK